MTGAREDPENAMQRAVTEFRLAVSAQHHAVKMARPDEFAQWLLTQARVNCSNTSSSEQPSLTNFMQAIRREMAIKALDIEMRGY